MARDGLWRAAAIVACAALPVGFYAVGDLADAFPGVLTLTSAAPEATAGPRAEGEDYERPALTPLAPEPAATTDPAADADLAGRMDAHAADGVVGGNLAFSVIDVDSGQVLAARDAATARTPASTLKFLTATAALRHLDPDDTLATSTVLEGTTLTLVGGGDMRLTEQSLGLLADAAAQRVRDTGTGPVTLALDDTLFSGGVNPGWGSNGPDGGWVAPTSALAIDEGWLDAQEYGAKSPDPSMDAAVTFQRLLRERGIEVTGDVVRAPAPAGGERDEIRSAPISDLVAHTLLVSDNTTAEVLGRLTALSMGLPATPEGAAQAVQSDIEAFADEQGIARDGFALVDTCGLAVDNRIPPELLAGTVAALDADTTPVALREILTDVPIGGLTGTLAERFGAPDALAGRGLIRGKTGYLGGAATLVGIAVRPDGRAVAFSIVVHGFDPTRSTEARAAIDAVATEIVTTS